MGHDRAGDDGARRRHAPHERGSAADGAAPLLDFWDDFSTDGRLDRAHARTRRRRADGVAGRRGRRCRPARPATSRCCWPGTSRTATRWRPRNEPPAPDDRVGNYYTTRYRDAWDVSPRSTPRDSTTSATRTRRFVSDVLRQRPAAGRQGGRALQSQHAAHADLLPHGRRPLLRLGRQQQPRRLLLRLVHARLELRAGDAVSLRLARLRRCARSSSPTPPTTSGLMSFRVHLPLDRAQEFGKAAADGQMGCVMKVYRDWQLSGDDAALQALWPHVRRVAGVLLDSRRLGCRPRRRDGRLPAQHDGRRVLRPESADGALVPRRAARRRGDGAPPRRRRRSPTRAAISSSAAAPGSTRTCSTASTTSTRSGRRPVPAPSRPSLLVGMGADDITNPDSSSAPAAWSISWSASTWRTCVGLGYLVQPEQVKTTLASILKYNRRDDLHAHFNPMRSFALADESALLMASYPARAAGQSVPVLHRGDDRLRVHRRRRHALRRADRRRAARRSPTIRARYDGRQRNPFDEAECGHHYARAMASWAAVLALTGFRYSAVTREFAIAAKAGPPLLVDRLRLGLVHGVR